MHSRAVLLLKREQWTMEHEPPWGITAAPLAPDRLGPRGRQLACAKSTEKYAERKPLLAQFW